MLSKQGPMFMFLSLSAVHTPLQVPEEYTKQYEDEIEDKDRRIFAGMTSCMDEGIKNLTEALQRHGLWKNTVLIFSSGTGFQMSNLFSSIVVILSIRIT